MSKKIEWHGGECPVRPGTRVKVYMRGGMNDDTSRAKSWFWGRTLSGDGPYDIIAYEVLDEPETQNTKESKMKPIDWTKPIRAVHWDGTVSQAQYLAWDGLENPDERQVYVRKVRGAVLFKQDGSALLSFGSWRIENVPERVRMWGRHEVTNCFTLWFLTEAMARAGSVPDLHVIVCADFEDGIPVGPIEVVK